jgi:MarR family transcriptional regulator, lower aerobic nicotinate degradation pathway regulator
MDDQSDHRHQRMIAMPGHLLRRCHQIAVALFLDECAPLDLTPLQYSVLIALAEHGPCDQASLGGLTAIDRTTAQVVCGNLSKLGLVTRTRSRVDKRAKIIAITPAGRELLRAAVPLVERTQQRIVAPLTPRERERLTRLLGKIADKNNAESRAPYKPALPAPAGHGRSAPASPDPHGRSPPGSTGLKGLRNRRATSNSPRRG